MSHQLFEVRMQVKFFDRRLKRGQQPNRKTNPASGLQNIYPAANAMNGLGSIERALLQKARPLLFADELPSIFQQHPGGKGLTGSPQRASHTNGRGQAGFQM